MLEEKAPELGCLCTVKVDYQDRMDVGLGAWKAQELTHTLTSASWTLAGAGGPGPRNRRNLRREGRCCPAAAQLLLLLGTFSELLRPPPTPPPECAYDGHAPSEAQICLFL